MAGEDIQGSTNEEVVSALSTITASGNKVSASLNLLQAFNPISTLSQVEHLYPSLLMCLDIWFL
jgi:hypothetical protein